MVHKMTIDKAIRDLQARVDGEFGIKGIDNCEDMKLGIEALKAVSLCRLGIPSDVANLLPGETEGQIEGNKMTIDEAIENLQQLLHTSSREKSPDSWDSLKLGIEALKEIKHLHEISVLHWNELLPGETEGQIEGNKMTLQKAINILSAMQEDYVGDQYPDEESALKLGVESLKFRLRWEQQEGETEFPLLPGETKH